MEKCSMCNAKCIYFPYVETAINYKLDKNGVKHTIHSTPYICQYNGNIIPKYHKCHHFKTMEDVKNDRVKG